MYIKLTRFDNRPVWLNAAFVVTVEPRREGPGSVVVPIGDGLDYDVRETPEEVLRLLEGCPAPAVVPVPVSDCLTQTPDDVSPEPERPLPQPEAVEPPKPARKAARSRKGAAEKKPKAAKESKAELSEDEAARLGRLAPKSLPKLRNTLVTQFHVADPAAVVETLAAKGVLALDGNRVDWKTPSGEADR